MTLQVTKAELQVLSLWQNLEWSQSSNLWQVQAQSSQQIRLLLPCLLCQNRGNRFYCQECVQAGAFGHSDPRKPDVLAEKRHRLQVKLTETEAIAHKIVSKGNEVREGDLQEKIHLCRQRIKHLSQLNKEKEEKVSKMQALGQKLWIMNQERRIRLPEFQRKVDQIQRASFQFYRDLSRDRAKCQHREASLTLLRRRRLVDLEQYLFPITQVFPDATKASVDDGLREELSDAIRTCYVNGRWVTTNETSGEMQVQIVSAMLSSVGDYTLFHDHQRQITTSNEFSIDPSSAMSIAAGLMYAAQLAQLMAAILGLVLPARIRYPDYGAIVSTEYRFSRRVTKLDLNVLYMCIRQNVDVAKLRTRGAVQNLKHLLDLAREEPSILWNSFTPFPNVEAMDSFSQELADEMDKVPITTEDGNDDDDDDVDYINRVGNEGDWDSLNNDLAQALPKWDSESGCSTCSHSPSSVSRTASSFVSTLWRGLTS